MCDQAAAFLSHTSQQATQTTRYGTTFQLTFTAAAGQGMPRFPSASLPPHFPLCRSQLSAAAGGGVSGALGDGGAASGETCAL
jgi:hypothetical protein